MKERTPFQNMFCASETKKTAVTAVFLWELISHSSKQLNYKMKQSPKYYLLFCTRLSLVASFCSLLTLLFDFVFLFKMLSITAFSVVSSSL